MSRRSRGKFEEGDKTVQPQIKRGRTAVEAKAAQWKPKDRLTAAAVEEETKTDIPELYNTYFTQYYRSGEGATNFQQACKGQIIVEDLPVFTISGASTSSSNDIVRLNKCVKILEEQINTTKVLPPSGYNPLNQENVFCSIKKKKEKKEEKIVIEKYDKTIRAQGLFNVSQIDSISEGDNTILNLLTSQDPTYKFAIQAPEGNPNGVLAISLYEALKITDELMQSQKKTNQYKIDFPQNLRNCKEIFEASRGLSAKEKEFANKVLSDAIMSINNSSSNNEDKLKMFTKVYGPLLNKGLSDISQAGELAKLYVLKYIQDKVVNPPKLLDEFTSTFVSSPDSTSPTSLEDITRYNIVNGLNFWETTRGLPSLAAFSSDTIASALGVRIQNLFKGQFQSIIPRKYGKGKFSVCYIPYKYVALMKLLELSDDMGLEPTEKQIFTKISDIKIAFNASMTTYLQGIIRIDFFSQYFFNKIRNVVEKIYKYYKIQKIDTDFFSHNIIDIINDKISKLQESNDLQKDKDLIYDINDELLIDIFFPMKSANIYDDDKITRRNIVETLEKIKDILIMFGLMIFKLSEIMSSPQDVDVLTKMANRWVESTQFNLKSWTGILYSTISYYENCKYFAGLNESELFDKYLEISTTEESCAEQDVDYGHDQTAETVYTLGTAVANLFNKREDFRPDIKSESKEEPFSKSLIDNLKYFSVAQSYSNTDGEPILIIKKTSNPKNDFMFDTTTSVPPASKIVNNIRSIGNAEALFSVDFTLGEPYIYVTKAALGTISQSDNVTLEDFQDYFEGENLIEIMTPATNFDAAAPSGCLYKNTGKMTVSYRQIIIGEETYIYVLLTLDLDPNSQNNVNFNLSQCQGGYCPVNLFSPNRKLRSDDITELMIKFSRNISNLGINDEKALFIKLLKECYIGRDGALKQFIENNSTNKLVTTIKPIIDTLVANINESGNSFKKMSTEFRDTKFIPAFKSILTNIGAYYNPTELSGEEKELIKDLIQIIYACLGLKTLSVTKKPQDLNQQQRMAGQQISSAADTLIKIGQDKGTGKGVMNYDIDISSQDINAHHEAEDNRLRIRQESIQQLLNLYNFNSEEQAERLYDEASEWWSRNKRIILEKLVPEQRETALIKYIEKRPRLVPDSTAINAKKMGVGGKLIRVKNPRKTRKPNKHRVTRKKHRNIRGRKTRHQGKKVRYTRHKK